MLVQEGGDVNMSGFSSRKALGHYVKFSWELAQCQVILAEFRPSGLGALLGHGREMLRHLARYLGRAGLDMLAGRRAYDAGPAPRSKAGAAGGAPA